MPQSGWARRRQSGRTKAVSTPSFQATRYHSPRWLKCWLSPPSLASPIASLNVTSSSLNVTLALITSPMKHAISKLRRFYSLMSHVSSQCVLHGWPFHHGVVHLY